MGLSEDCYIKLAFKLKTSKRFFVKSKLRFDNSKTVNLAPALAKLIASVPKPHPISSTFLFFSLKVHSFTYLLMKIFFVQYH